MPVITISWLSVFLHISTSMLFFKINFCFFDGLFYLSLEDFFLLFFAFFLNQSCSFINGNYCLAINFRCLLKIFHTQKFISVGKFIYCFFFQQHFYLVAFCCEKNFEHSNNYIAILFLHLGICLLLCCEII